MGKFNDLLASDKPVLVDFTATWCGPCKTMSPILQEVKNQLGETVAVVKVDVDRNPEAAAKFDIQGVPTLILFKKGNILWRSSGVIPADQLKANILRNI